MREFLEATAYCLILAISTLLVVYVGQKLFDTDEAEKHEKYESMVEGLILTNREQHNMLLECMEGDKNEI